MGIDKNSYLKNFEYKKEINLQDPIIPIYPFGVNMNFDIVLSVKDGQYSMYEVIRADLSPEKSIWLILDSKFNGKQFIGLPEDSHNKKLVQQLASTLGVKTYEANLQPPQINKEDKSTKYTISYTRKDPEKINPDKKMNFTIEIPNDLDLNKKNHSTSLYTKENQRNSHCMNHSSSKFMGLIDIYKSLPFTKSNKMKILFNNLNKNQVKSHNFDLQKILGVQVKSMLSQTVVGIGNANYTQGKSEITDLPLKKINEDSKNVIYEVSNNLIKDDGDDIEFQNIQYKFKKINEHLELKSIEIRQKKNEKLLGLIEFNPSLPDLRYSTPNYPQISKMTIAIDGKDGISENAEEKQSKLIFYLGGVRIQNDQDGKSKLVEILPGNFNKGHRYRFLRTPEWMYGRPVTTFINPDITKTNIQVQSYVMNAKDKMKTVGEYQLPKVKEEVKVLRSWDIKWNVRSHRFARIVIRHGKNKNDELRQINIPGHKDRKSVAYLLGGTWENGKKGKDTALGYACSQTVKGGNFYEITSKTFPLFQSLVNFPFNKEYFNSEKASVEGLHQLKIKIPPSLRSGKFFAFINGIRMSSGPNHRETGVTINGFEFKVYNEDTELLDGTIIQGIHRDPSNQDTLIINIEAKQGFGPELTRPVAGLFRQNLLDYSAYASLDLVLIDTQYERLSGQNYKDHIYRPFRINLPGKSSPLAAEACEEYEYPLTIGEDNFSLLTKIGFKSLRPSKYDHQDSKKEDLLKNSRYLRSISFKLSNDITADGKPFQFQVDNSGEISWKTHYVKEVDLLIFN